MSNVRAQAAMRCGSSANGIPRGPISRSQRRVYSITSVGKEHFHELLRQNLAEADSLILPGAIGLIFIDHLAPAERLDYLRRHLADLDRQIAIYAQVPAHTGQVGVALAIDRQLALFLADHVWLTGTIAELATREADDASMSTSTHVRPPHGSSAPSEGGDDEPFV